MFKIGGTGVELLRAMPMREDEVCSLDTTTMRGTWGSGISGAKIRHFDSRMPLKFDQ